MTTENSLSGHESSLRLLMMTVASSWNAEFLSFESFKCLLLEMAHERSVDGLLRLIVKRLVEEPAVAWAQVWLLEAKHSCGNCPRETCCPQQEKCLRLVTGLGDPTASGDGGDLRDLARCSSQVAAVTRRLAGTIAARGSPVEVASLETSPEWEGCVDWLRLRGICGFAGQPLRYKGDVLGALLVLIRAGPSGEATTWLRVIADHAATAIANARAFEEIQRLKKRLELERDYLREAVQEAHSFGEIIGQSAAIRNLVEQIDLVAPTDASVLIQGESGTGKELVATEIHKRSRRRDHPMIKVNCASIPRELYESEFFGHVRGAFTGAVKHRAGRFELADAGTLFLDEVGEIPYSLQGKLLRVLQEGEFERVGEETTRRVDVRIIAATNRDLGSDVAAGRFRQDLFYRLNVFPIHVPPLRRHKEDIPLLAARFVKRAAAGLNRPCPRLTQADILRLQQYDWPGNVRELGNAIERTVITSRNGRLQFDLPFGRSPSPDPPRVEGAAAAPPKIVTYAEMKRRERENVLVALEQTGWKIYGPRGAAAMLGIKPTTLASRIKKLGLKRPR